jgi:hypothetical protein
MAASGYFPPRVENETTAIDSQKARFASRSKIAGLRHPPLALRPSALLRVLARSACRQVIATKAAMGAADPAKDILP